MNPQSKKIKVLVVDDHPIYRDGIRNLLKKFPFVSDCDEADDGQMAIAKMESNVYDIVFLDIEMPVLDGVATAAIIKQNFPNTKIIILTSSANKRQIVELLNMKVGGYILKNTDKNEIKTAIVKVMVDDLYLTPEVFNIYAKYLIFEANKPYTFFNDVELTEREIEVLKLICLQYSTIQIAEKLYLSEATANNHRANMMKKLKIDNVVGLVIYAVKKGYFIP